MNTPHPTRRTPSAAWLFEGFLIAGYIAIILAASYLRGPVYQLVTSEVSYILLFNGVNLIEGKPLGFYVHSLPLIEIGAVLSFLLHILQGGFDFADSVARSAETFSIALDVAVFVFTGMGLVRFFRCLRYSWGLTAEFFALLPFLALPAFGYVIVLHAGPEAFALGCTFWMLVFLLPGAEPPSGSRTAIRTAAIAGIFAGLGLATKVNFFPVVLAAIMVVAARIPFLIAVTATMILVYLPIAGQWPEVLAQFGPNGVVWSGNAVARKGFAGWSAGFSDLCAMAPLFVALTGAVTVLAVIHLKTGGSISRWKKWLFASVAACVCALAMVGMRPATWYLVPVLPLLSLAVSICVAAEDGLPRWKMFASRLLVAAMAISSVAWISDQLQITREIHDLNKTFAKKELALIESRGNCAAILQVASTHPFAAIFHAANYSRGAMWPAIGKILPTRYYWHILEKPEVLLDRHGTEIPAAQVLAEYPCAIVTGTPLQEGRRRPDVIPPKTFVVDGYCPAEPAFGYDCKVCLQDDECLGYVTSFDARPVLSVLQAPQRSFPPRYLTDGSQDTFWEIESNGMVSVELKMTPAVAATGYRLATGKHGENGFDSISRMPRNWRLYAADAGGRWIPLDEVTATAPWKAGERRRFPLKSTQSYARYKFEFEMPEKQTILRIYEIALDFERGERTMKHPDDK